MLTPQIFIFNENIICMSFCMQTCPESEDIIDCITLIFPEASPCVWALRYCLGDCVECGASGRVGWAKSGWDDSGSFLPCDCLPYARNCFSWFYLKTSRLKLNLTTLLKIQKQLSIGKYIMLQKGKLPSVYRTNNIKRPQPHIVYVEHIDIQKRIQSL